jgi:probable rRNA maturation factor
VGTNTKRGGDIEPSLRRFLMRAKKEIGLRGEVNVLLTGNSKMRALNRKFRKKNKPTDVLSFPVTDENGSAGDIAISTDIAIQQARRLGHSLDQELRVLLLHGLLHLAGYDHENDQGEMLRAERKLRAKFRLPGSLSERGMARTNYAQ